MTSFKLYCSIIEVTCHIIVYEFFWENFNEEDVMLAVWVPRNWARNDD